MCAGFLETCMIASAVRGFHVYMGVWTPKKGELLTTEFDPINPYDKNAVSIKKGHLIVGHIPREQAKVCRFFIKRGGIIQVEVTDTNRRRSQIPEGGLEIPAALHFVGSCKDIGKLLQLQIADL